LFDHDPARLQQHRLQTIPKAYSACRAAGQLDFRSVLAAIDYLASQSPFLFFLFFHA
jgi:hypothetical protein